MNEAEMESETGEKGQESKESLESEQRDAVEETVEGQDVVKGVSDTA